MAAKTGQFNFLITSKEPAEYLIYGFYGSEVGEVPSLVEKRPYGTMLIEFLDMDISLVGRMKDTLLRFSSVQSVDDYTKNWSDFKDDIWKMESVAESLPPVFGDLITVFNFFVNEYMKDPATIASFSAADVERMVRGASIIKDHCDKIIDRHALLHSLIKDGKLRGGKGGQADKILAQVGEDNANALMDCNVQAHYVMMERGGRTELELCFDAGVDLSSFLMVYLGDIMNSHMEISLCQHCGKPFVTGGRAIYCDRKLNAGGSCRSVGAVNKYTKSLAENTFTGQYRRAYKKNYARLNKGSISKEEFEKWRDDAKKALSLLNAEKGTEEQFLSALNKL